jgi:uncharacterized surface protein with fasciclin (FAS1) repeats
MMLAFASMVLLALAVDAAGSDGLAEIQKRHKTKYGSSKRSHPKFEDEHKYEKDEYKSEHKYEKEGPKHYKKEEPSYKTHGDDKYEYKAPEYKDGHYKEDPVYKYGPGPMDQDYKKYGHYDLTPEYKGYNDYSDPSYDGYGEDNYYSDAYDNGYYGNKWCRGDTLQDALVHALWKFDELNLFKVMVMKSDLDSITSINKTSALTVFAPCDDAIKEWCKENSIDLDDLFDDENDAMVAKLLEIVAAHITNDGAFKTWDLLNKNGQYLNTLDTATKLQVVIEDVKLGMDKEINIAGPKNTGLVEAPSNIRVCKAIIHTIDDVIKPA